VADYITITEAQSDPEAAVDSSLIKRLRDNPIAIAEAATGAPIVKGGWHSWNGTTYGSSALIYDHAVDGNVLSIETPVLDNDYQYQLVWAITLPGKGIPVSEITLSFFLSDTSAYTIVESIGSGFTDARRFSGSATISQQTNAENHQFYNLQNVSTSTGSVLASTVVSADSTNKVFHRTTATRITRMRVSASRSDHQINGGRVYLFRRKFEGL
jgi:hypothetical protein